MRKMSQRRPDPTKWVWYLLALSCGPPWNPVNSVSVRSPDKIPSIIENQAKFFQDFFSVQLSPYKIEFGHVCEDPNTWEQRYEKKDFKNHRDMGKVRWGDKKGGYGEHYWDLNHAGQVAANQEEDEEYYDDEDYSEDIQDSLDPAIKATNDREEYYPDASEYERSKRPKRENSKIEIQALLGERKYIGSQRNKPKRSISEANRSQGLINRSLKNYGRIHDHGEKYIHSNDKNHIFLDVDHIVKNNKGDSIQTAFRRPEVSAGVRYLSKQISPPSVPRLFLESFTGHVVDSATGKAYVLQPI